MHAFGGGRQVAVRQIAQRVAHNRDGSGCEAEHAQQRRLGNGDRLLRLNQTRLRRGALCFGARRLRSWPQLVVDQCLDGTAKHVAALDVGLQRSRRPLRAHDGKERIGDRDLHFEFRQRLAGTGPLQCRLCAGDTGTAQTEVERLP
jgi:hypothetical protein